MTPTWKDEFEKWFKETWMIEKIREARSYQEIALSCATWSRERALEEAARVADRYDYGKADEHIPDDKIEAFNSGCEDAKEDIASSIRALKGEGA